MSVTPRGGGPGTIPGAATQWKDDILWTHGKHNLKFGGSYMYTHKWQQFQLNAGGQFNFNGSATGNGFADFLTGFRLFVQRTSQCGFRAYLQRTTTISTPWTTGGSATGLTFNLGIRWEGIPHAYDSEGTASNFYPNLYDPKQAATFLPSGALDTNGPGFTTVSSILLSNVKFYMNGVGIAGQNGIPEGSG